jgi:3-(3-hydroxy-phenyl)propionate hydroxylase
MSAGAAYQLPEFPFRLPPELGGAGASVPTRYPLVIVGAGLAGLTLACDLASRGVRALVLDDDHTVGVRGASSRGIVYVQKTLEVMARLGVYERIAAKGVRWSVARVLAGEQVLYSADAAQASVGLQPPFVNIQQFYVEWFLVDRIAELGLTDLRWHSQVVAAEVLADGVRLGVHTPAGRYDIVADWVVDAEGVASFLRQHLGLAEHTERTDDRWCITDVRFEGALPNERWTWAEAPFNEGRAVWQHRMADDVWRLDFQMAPDSDPAFVSRPDVARERVARMLGPATKFELVWVGPYAYRTMLMERFVHGRIVFVGDAAHAKSPFGARGGNSGIHDADALGWRLALLLGGHADAAILQGFAAERRRAAEENIRITARSGRFLRPRSRAERLLRRATLGLAPRHAFARALVDTGRLCAPHHYQGLPGTAPGAGAALPNLALGARELIDWLGAGPQPVAFVFAAAAPALEQVARGGLLRVALLGRDFDDPDGQLARLTQAQPGAVALVRADGHHAATLADAAPGPLLAALKSLLGDAGPGMSPQRQTARG